MPSITEKFDLVRAALVALADNKTGAAALMALADIEAEMRRLRRGGVEIPLELPAAEPAPDEAKRRQWRDGDWPAAEPAP